MNDEGIVVGANHEKEIDVQEIIAWEVEYDGGMTNKRIEGKNPRVEEVTVTNKADEEKGIGKYFFVIEVGRTFLETGQIIRTPLRIPYEKVICFAPIPKPPAVLTDPNITPEMKARFEKKLAEGKEKADVDA